MKGRQLTMWDLPMLLLRLLPEAAMPIATATVQAWQAAPENLDLRSPDSSSPDSSEHDAAEDSSDDRIEYEIGSRIYVELAPHGLFGGIFGPIFHAALDADPIDEDCARRCCEFIEQVLSGDEYVVGAFDIMVIDNMGSWYAERVYPFAGPAFREVLRLDVL